ncbi:MAG: bifunctional glutamate N-acetyltransferase/amino-acid acetyltransferase ArgJ [Deltaproteobacteria bacterium]|nr:bifunctional glutamate N-acetyltransferase/amino-acid acetyltransferase ArgJ [Deltaproteobacteria bacterium]
MKNTKHTIQGFKASAVAAGLKKDHALDLALIFSEKEATAAGVFTTNQVKAAPVILSQEHMRKGKARAIIANAGCANACSGKAGLEDARMTAGLLAEELGINSHEVLVASTGVIGQSLDMERIRSAVPGLVEALAPEGMDLAARAIMTTDSFPKISQFEGQAGGLPYHILGIAKGAGMIMPNMATMLAFVISDIAMDAEDLKGALLSSVESTFNRITVDGDTSTNDTVLALANGMAGNGALSPADSQGFARGLETVLGELADMMVRDGEGATKLVRITIKGAHSAADALKGARTVANSCLVKTAFFGQDPNWGRIMAALGRSDIVMKEENTDIWVDDVLIVSAGLGKGKEAEKRAAQRMANKEFSLTIDLHQGSHEDRIITCDLTHEYITINADYRT